jgi:hypothetical protein
LQKGVPTEAYLKTAPTDKKTGFLAWKSLRRDRVPPAPPAAGPPSEPKVDPWDPPPGESQPVTRGGNLGPRVKGSLIGVVVGELLNVSLSLLFTGEVPIAKEAGKDLVIDR